MDPNWAVAWVEWPVWTVADGSKGISLIVELFFPEFIMNGNACELALNVSQSMSCCMVKLLLHFTNGEVSVVEIMIRGMLLWDSS